MSEMRNRVKEYFPSVLLTLLSIVQAVALELLWSHIQGAHYLFEFSISSLIGWAQMVATFMGLILVWVIYASNAMRFRWVPTTGDSVYPFFIGLFEFALIDMLGPENTGIWLILMSMIFAIMVCISHVTLVRARADEDNSEFFTDVEPAKLADFYVHIVAISLLLIGGLYLHFSQNTGITALIIMLIAMGMLIWQYFSNAKFWEESVSIDS